MLTKDEIKQFRQIVKEEIYPVTTKLEEHDVRFNQVTGKLEEHDKRFNQVTTKLEEHDKRFNQVTTKLEEHDKRFNIVDKKLKSLEDNIKTVVIFFDKGYLGLAKKVETLEQHLGLTSFAQ